jgi:mannose-6-phosphate isomerase-like protein (cupin superfamily)
MSLSEAVVDVERTTKLHYHKTSEEIYFVFEGEGQMEIEGGKKEVSKDQTIVIPQM